MQHFTDIFIKRPVWAIVISLVILALGLKAVCSLPVLQYPYTESAQITISTVYVGASSEDIAAFITTPLENAIAQADGIDYLTSSSVQGSSTINANLRLNFDPNKAITQINTQINATLNQLPPNAQPPVISIAIGQTTAAMNIGFYSDQLPANQITDYLTRVVQPKLQAIAGVQQAQIIGGSQYALRAWLDPAKLAAYNLTTEVVSQALSNNNSVAAVGRTDGNTFVVNLTADTTVTNVEQFKQLVITTVNNAIIRLGDIADVRLGAQSYDASATFDGKPAVYIAIQLTPSANLLHVLNVVKQTLPDIETQLPQGLNAAIVYDSSDYVHNSIKDVVKALFEAFAIVTVVIFFFLGSIRALSINFVSIPLSLIGTFFCMLALGYSINLLTLLSLVLAIGLVVDDAIIVGENVQRHIELGKTPLDAALIGARELLNPIIAMTIVLIAVYAPIGFMGGLTGTLFTEFAFTLAAAVTISAIIALTLSPMMCATYLRPMDHSVTKHPFLLSFERGFTKLSEKYQQTLQHSLDFLSVTVVFAIFIFISIYFLFISSQSELAPQEDQGLILTQSTAAPNAPLRQTEGLSQQIYNVFQTFPSVLLHAYTFNGNGGLNSSVNGMVLKPWDDRSLSTNQIQPQIQVQLSQIAGATIAAFQPASLPGGGSGLPVQFVITSTAPFSELNSLTTNLLNQAQASGKFTYIDSDLKIDKQQVALVVDRDKAAQLGITMQNLSSVLNGALSENYVNYFNFDGRSYQVIPQVGRLNRLNYQQVLNYYITTGSGASVPLSTIVHLEPSVAPESINHFQQLNSATLSGVLAPGIGMGDALQFLQKTAHVLVPSNYSLNYAGQSRQFITEGSSLILTFLFALITIYLALAALFNSFRDPVIVLISVPMSICGAMLFVSLGVGGANLNIYTEVGLVTLIGLISKHGILMVQFANDAQVEGKSKREAIVLAAVTRFRPILMTTSAMVFGVVPLIIATGAGAISRYNLGLVIATGISIGTAFTFFVVPAMYLLLAKDHRHDQSLTESTL